MRPGGDNVEQAHRPDLLLAAASQHDNTLDTHRAPGSYGNHDVPEAVLSLVRTYSNASAYQPLPARRRHLCIHACIGGSPREEHLCFASANRRMRDTHAE